jgi:hypothetical protein
VNERLKAALARRIEAHNRLVKLTTVWSGLLVMLMWVVLYLVANWFVIFFATIVHGVDAEQPRQFWVVFAVGATLWTMIAWVERLRTGGDRRTERTMAGALIDILFAPPRVTLAVIANFCSRISFSEIELDRATVFLERMGRAGKIPVESIDSELPDEDTRKHILESLQLIDLVCARCSSRGVEHLYPANPQSLVRFLN